MKQLLYSNIYNKTDNFKKVLTDIQEWQKENRDKTLGYMREHYQNNKDKRREYVKEWITNNPEKAREYQQQHRDHDITDNEWNACKEFFNNSCAYCGLHIDEHFVLRNNSIIDMDLNKEHVDDNGANDVRNCVPSCQSCNSTKNTKTIEELLESGLIAEFNQEKYKKIILWISEEYKKYIEYKPPYRIRRCRMYNEDNTYNLRHELWTVDEYRNIIECIAVSDKKQRLKKYIQKHFPDCT